jgi:glycogen operon protein
MSDEAWNAGYVRCLGVRLAGDMIGDLDERGEPIVGETLLVLLNAHHEAIPFTLPPTKPEHRWERLLDTAQANGEAAAWQSGAQYALQGRSLAVLRARQPQDNGQAGPSQPSDRPVVVAVG